jgi:hypothetical protein
MKAIIVYYIPSKLFDKRAVCRGNNELILVPWNKILNILIISCLVSIVKYTNNNNKKRNILDGRKDGRTDGQTNRGKTVCPPPPSGSRGIIIDKNRFFLVHPLLIDQKLAIPILLIFIHI